ncbi:alanine racemase [Desulfovibrio litoralis]|uniref:Alanine racemase n=1 Tax=Desulfovibrio litoralis DSM 11393 TaxID=1121455 RepID=A0A1M7TAR7_9BACT|nr:alanine racemase [Desulfovibrio litoralis]SHN67747.1 alanine racemase [Desulfovibrio litoralis DSM 11393]
MQHIDFNHQSSQTTKNSLVALKNNFIFLEQEAKKFNKNFNHGFFQNSVLPIIKANAYGHGLETIGRSLFQHNVRCFGVGTSLEAVKLKSTLAQNSEFDEQLKIISLLGVKGKDEAYLCVKHKILPLIGTKEELELLLSCLNQESGLKTPFPVALKFNTGMSRLGFNFDDANALREYLKQNTCLKPVLLASHLACADEIEQNSLEKTIQQAQIFSEIVNTFHASWQDITASLCNSAGLLNHAQISPHLKIKTPQLFRPGIALYGINPFYGTELEKNATALEPVMQVLAPVLTVRTLKKGDEVSYGGTFVAPSNMRVAVLGIGYADGLLRSVAKFNQLNHQANATDYAHFILHGRKVRLLGRICMQMCVVDISDIPEGQVKIGDQAFILGGEKENMVKAEQLAKWGETIAYELLCSLGGR